MRKKSLPIAYQLTELPNRPYEIETCSEKIKEILNELQIEKKILSKRGKSISMHIKALKNTWSHQRRKRRLLKRQEEQEAKRMRSDSSGVNESSQNESLEKLQRVVNSAININHNNNNGSILESQVTENDISACQEPILQAFLKIFKKDDAILCEIEYLDGNAGKEGLHQIVQYIKNNWK